MEHIVNTEKKWWLLSPEQVIRALNTDASSGLAFTHIRRLRDQFGRNVLPEAKPLSPFLIFFRQFYSVVVAALICAVVISFFLGEYVDVAAMSAIIILNAIIGFIQEYSAEKTIRGLRNYLQQRITVIRDGEYQDIAVEELVPGDIVELNAGDKVPADGRIIYQAHLTIDQAALTGESIPVRKQSAAMQATDKDLLAVDQTNMAFMGTSVLSGTALMAITAIGSYTHLGGIAQLLQKEEDKKTSFEQEINKLEHMLLLGSLVVVAVVFGLGLVRGFSLSYLALTTISLAVAAIPEGLPVVTTVALAYGLRIMAKKNVIIRRLHAVETLGSTTVICTDKTGTITENQMRAMKLWVHDATYEVVYGADANTVSLKQNDLPVDPHKDEALSLLLTTAALSSGAELSKHNGAWTAVGDPTEGATLLIAQQAGFDNQTLENIYKLVEQRPFDSDRKMASYLRQSQKEGKKLFIEGAPEVVLAFSKQLVEGSAVRPITEADRALIQGMLDRFAQRALRVVALAYKPSEEINQGHIDDSLEKDLTFIGMIALEDPPRQQAKEAVALCKQAGIHVMMITGDHEKTAAAIAQQIGLLDQGSIVLNGTLLQTMSDDELIDIIDTVAVCARTTADQKMRIVRALQQTGNTVAMTGDGVNDAPAIKAADIGIAMGITGTDVSKESSDMVILDDNFASIVAGVQVGRTIFDNIKKFVNYLLSSNLTELLVITCDVLLAQMYQGQPYISLLPIHILWINLVTDGFPALALAIDPQSSDVMKEPVKARSTAIVSKRLFAELITIATILALTTLAVSHYGLIYGATVARTMAFTLLVMLEFVRLYTIRAEYALPLFSNFWLIVACSASLMCQIAVMYVPILQVFFKTAPLDSFQWLIILGATVCAFGMSTLVVSLIRKMLPATQV